MPRKKGKSNTKTSTQKNNKVSDIAEETTRKAMATSVSKRKRNELDDIPEETPKNKKPKNDSSKKRIELKDLTDKQKKELIEKAQVAAAIVEELLIDGITKLETPADSDESDPESDSEMDNKALQERYKRRTARLMKAIDEIKNDIKSFDPTKSTESLDENNLKEKLETIIRRCQKCVETKKVLDSHGCTPKFGREDINNISCDLSDAINNKTTILGSIYSTISSGAKKFANTIIDSIKRNPKKYVSTVASFSAATVVMITKKILYEYGASAVTNVIP